MTTTIPLGWKLNKTGTIVPDIEWRVINDFIAVEGRLVRATRVAGWDDREDAWETSYSCDPPIRLRIASANQHDLYWDLLRDLDTCYDPYYEVEVLEPLHPDIKGVSSIQIEGWTIIIKTGEPEAPVPWEVID